MLESKFREQSGIFNLEVNEHVKHIFLNMARWTKFLAILGFIFIGIMVVGLVLVFILSKTELSGLDSNTKTVLVGETIGLCIVSIGISFYPSYTLLMYSARIKRAFSAQSQEQFESALNQLKNNFKYVSILMIVSLFTSCISYAFLLIAAMKSNLV